MRQRTLAIGAGQGLAGGIGQAVWAGPVPSGSGRRQRVTSKPRAPSSPTSANSLDRVKWKPPKVAEVVDRRVVVNRRQARELLTAVTYVSRPWRGRHLRAFFACM